MGFFDLWNDMFGVGLPANEIGAGQMAMRSVLIYAVTLAFVRLAKKRFLSQASAFDVVVGIIIGSIASRTITGNAPLFPSMAACAAIIAMHWLMSALAVRSHRFGETIKGSSCLLVRDGRLDEGALRAAHMTRRDLKEALRQGGVQDVGEVKEAHLERNGRVSIIKN